MTHSSRSFSIVMCFAFFCFNANLSGQTKYIEFDSISWNLTGAKVVDFQGRRALTGTALLKDIVFTNGIIETDLWVDGSRSYPTILFRYQSEDEYEHVYFRPHRAGLYDDAVQYAPSFNGQACWQLYSGNGYTSESNFAPNKWQHLKLIVKDTTAQFFVENMTEPVLEINNLAHGISKGAIGLSTTTPNNYFSNFKLNMTNNIVLTSKDNTMLMLGNIGDWEISKSFAEDAYSSDIYPDFYSIFYSGWEKIQSEPNGLINISRYRKLEKQKTQCVYARTYIVSDMDRTIKAAFGYSDAVKIFFNLKPVYSGDYAYRSRSNSFTGTITMKDTLYLDLKKGLNELFLISSETFGGWGFAFKSVPEVSGVRNSDKHPVKLWETAKKDLQPESVLYDSTDNMIYYSQFDSQFYRNDKPMGYISKVNMNGEIVKMRWSDSLYAPAGICRYKDKMYICERKDVAEVSMKTGKIIKRYPLPEDARFPNDIAEDGKGNIYITNSAVEEDVTDIYILRNNHIKIWMKSKEISNLNGIICKGSEIIVGNCDKGLLQAIDIKTKNMRTIASVGASVVDGIQIKNDSTYLVSNWIGNLYEITESGNVVQLLNSDGKYNMADFTYVANKGLLLIPTFMNGNLQAYKITK